MASLDAAWSALEQGELDEAANLLRSTASSTEKRFTRSSAPIWRALLKARRLEGRLDEGWRELQEAVAGGALPPTETPGHMRSV